MRTEEIWHDLDRFPSHQVSSHGRVRNKRTGRVLKPFADRYGYLRLSIGNTDNVYIHRLVCETFLGEPENGANQVNHIDGDRQNNHLSNLEWCTPSENVRWSRRYGRLDPMKGLRIAIAMNHTPVRIVELNKEFNSVRDCAEFLGVLPTCLSRVLTGARKGQRIHGYHVEYM